VKTQAAAYTNSYWSTQQAFFKVHDMKQSAFSELWRMEKENIRPVFHRLPEPNRAWLLVVYFSR